MNSTAVLVMTRYGHYNMSAFLFLFVFDVALLLFCFNAKEEHVYYIFTIWIYLENFEKLAKSLYAKQNFQSSMHVVFRCKTEFKREKTPSVSKIYRVTSYRL